MGQRRLAAQAARPPCSPRTRTSTAAEAARNGEQRPHERSTVSNGMNTSWIRGERTTGTLKGKNGGLVITQEVIRVHTPKGAK